MTKAPELKASALLSGWGLRPPVLIFIEEVLLAGHDVKHVKVCGFHGIATD